MLWIVKTHELWKHTTWQKASLLCVVELAGISNYFSWIKRTHNKNLVLVILQKYWLSEWFICLRIFNSVLYNSTVYESFFFWYSSVYWVGRFSTRKVNPRPMFGFFLFYFRRNSHKKGFSLPKTWSQFRHVNLIHIWKYFCMTNLETHEENNMTQNTSNQLLSSVNSSNVQQQSVEQPKKLQNNQTLHHAEGAKYHFFFHW